ncbi:MAG TPA: outer membrane protein assembly factor BamD [Alphaproteobacteria bacterium]|jgi:outer membrane protein assembly factor BamD|nr:outer membrane protein assembly factor BamD [Alphaproteobacteria bacterium]
MSRPTVALRFSNLRRAGAIGLVLALAACGTPEPKTVADAPPESLFNRGMNELTINRNAGEAIKYFDEVDRQHPYSVWANKAQLMSAYALYASNKYENALTALDRFIQLHPGSRDAPYAYYLKALCYYERITDITRDQEITQQAMNSLQDVIRRFPDTEYARDSQIKIDLTRDHLAGKEMDIGRFYMKRNQYLAAINRFRRVVEVYQTTSQVPEALERLTEAYLAIGLTEEAQASAAVLGHNFPGSEWYVDAYDLLMAQNLEPKASQTSWLGRVWNSVF